MKKKSFNQRVYEITRLIPRGFVLCYGDIAHIAGNPRASRAVGYALAACPQDVPAHRVLHKDGSLSKAFYDGRINRQYILLKAEGISFTKEKKAKTDKHRWQAEAAALKAFLDEGI